MAQGVAWWARRRGIPCTVVLPDTAPQAKIEAIRRLGAEMIPVSYEEWHETFRTHEHEGLDGLFVHAFSDDAVMAGNGTIGLEILEDLPDADVILAPYGGGGLSCGIASAVRAVAPGCKVFAAEVETGAPLAPSLEAGRPVRVDYEPSFVDGIGGPEVFTEMFELAQRGARRIARGEPRRGHGRGPAPGRPRTHRGGRCRRHPGCAGAERSRRERQGRLRRVRRQHRRLEAGRDPYGLRAELAQRG